MSNVLKKFRRALLYSGAILMALFPILALPSPATAANTGTIQGTLYVEIPQRDGKTNNVPLSSETTTITLEPNAGDEPQIEKGNIRITNVPVGRYNVTIKFLLTKDTCGAISGAIGIITGPLLGLLSSPVCNVFTDQVYYGLTRVYVVEVKEGQTAQIDGSSETTPKSMGPATLTDSEGNVKLDCSSDSLIGGLLTRFVLCPGVETMLLAIQWGLNYFIVPFLQVQPLRTINVDGSPNPMFVIWENLRNLANLLFIFIFFAIIFSQATSVGINNYGIKKLLPRLIIFAILTNLSFFICALLTDISNIAGAGIGGLVTSVVLNGRIDFNGDALIAVAVPLIMTGLLLNVALAPIIIVVGFVFILTITALLFITIIALLLRQVLLIFLVIVSPLAFAAAILPNTASLFSRWFNLFLRLLIMYPILILFFSVGVIISMVLTQVGG